MNNNSSSQCPLREKNCSINQKLHSLENEIIELNKKIQRDPLTGLYNIEHLTTTLKQEMERTLRSQNPTSLIMIDIDHFKKLNDTYGHMTGNAVLKALAKNLNSTLRVLDTACRYGGEEFTVILPATSLLTSAQVAERIREAIANMSVLSAENTPQNVQVTVSLGVGSYGFNLNETTDMFLDRVDKELYKAKQQGRNQVCFTPTNVKPSISVSAEEKAALFFNDQEDSAL